MLRIDENLIFTIIDLLILFIGLRFTLFKPVKETIEKRQALIDESLKQADASKEAAQESLRKYEESLQNIDVERKQILDEARKNASLEYARVLEEANKKAGETLEDARILAMNEKKEVMRVAQKEITDMVIKASEKVSQAKADPANDALLFDKFISEAGEL